MLSRRLLLLGCTAVMSTQVTSTLAANIVIGVPDWPSLRATANALKVALEKNFDVEVELQNGSNPIIFGAMNSGSIQVHPEVWLPDNNHLKKLLVDAG